MAMKDERKENLDKIRQDLVSDLMAEDGLSRSDAERDVGMIHAMNVVATILDIYMKTLEGEPERTKQFVGDAFASAITAIGRAMQMSDERIFVTTQRVMDHTVLVSDPEMHASMRRFYEWRCKTLEDKM